MRHLQLGRDNINLDKFRVVELSQRIQMMEQIVECTV